MTVDEIRKLGWLSSYTRQVLLARHALRTFVILSEHMARAEAKSGFALTDSIAEDALRLLRLLNDILSSDNRNPERVAAPYEPINRPVDFFLGESRKGRLFAVSTSSASSSLLQIGTGFAVEGPAKRQTSRWIGSSVEGNALSVLAHETLRVRKGVTLRNKKVADARCEALISEELWPTPTSQAWAAKDLFAPFNEARNDAFKYWEEWYQGFLDGRPLEREFRSRISRIPDDDWEQGPVHIASIIEKLRLQTRTDVSPSLVRSADNTTFEVEHDTRLPDEVLAFVCNRIEGTLQSALSAGLANGFHDASEEAQVIRAALDSDAKGASLVATAFYDACLSLTTNIGDRYPEVTSLINLKNALYAAVEEICELDELARKRCARLAKLQTARPMTPEDRALVAKASEMVGDDVNEEARELIESDVERILSTPTPPKSIRARFANWMTTISLWLDRAEKTDKKAKWLSDLVSRMQRWWPTGGE